ncbi:MAG: DUF1574 family protein [Spirochaetales bacterium]|nr:DUF1574 family protein [Spirochaetales bacterium]
MKDTATKWILICLASLATLFVLDKLFLLPEVRDNFIQPGGMIYYRQRARQIEPFRRFACEHADSRVTLVLGDSRVFALGQDMLDKEDRRKWEIWNFAGPQAIPAYHYYLARKLIDTACPPRYLLLGVAPDSFNRNAAVFASPVLNFGTDGLFAEQEKTHIPAEALRAYAQTRRFALHGLGFSFNTFIVRLRGSLSGHGQSGPEDELSLIMEAPADSLLLYSLEHSPHRRVLDRLRGAQFAWIGQMSDDDLKEETRRLKEFYLSRFRVSPEQVYFFRRTVEIAERSGVKTLLFWPRVNPHLQKAYTEHPALQALWREMQILVARAGGSSVDLNQEDRARCESYYDASHLSATCFKDITPFLLEKLP